MPQNLYYQRHHCNEGRRSHHVRGQSGVVAERGASNGVSAEGAAVATDDS